MIKKIPEFKLCSSIVSKAIGIMFKNNPKPHLFVFKKDRTIPIHTFFVRQNIDLVYLNKHNKAIEIKQDLKPYSLYKNRKKARYLIEIASTSGKRIRLGDIVSFK